MNIGLNDVAFWQARKLPRVLRASMKRPPDSNVSLHAAINRSRFANSVNPAVCFLCSCDVVPSNYRSSGSRSSARNSA